MAVEPSIEVLPAGWTEHISKTTGFFFFKVSRMCLCVCVCVCVCVCKHVKAPLLWGGVGLGDCDCECGFACV